MDFLPQYIQAKKLIDQAKKILLISHRRPDGDTLGANIALHLAFQDLGKDTTLACADTPSERFSFLPDIKKFVKEFDYKEFDLICVSDAGAYYMTSYHEKYPGLFSGEMPMINFDHHVSNEHYGTVNMVDGASASTTVILYKFFQFLGVYISPAIATALLTGIYNDTGGLMHSNTNKEVFDISAELVRKGAKLRILAKKMFKSDLLSTLRLWGRILESVKMNPDGIVMAVVTAKDLKECGANPEEAGGVIDMLNSVPGSKFTVLLNEDFKGNVKGSFRTNRNDVDLSEIASLFGGGGHKKAAGFTLPGHIEKEIRWKIISDKPLERKHQGLLSDGKGKFIDGVVVEEKS